MIGADRKKSFGLDAGQSNVRILELARSGGSAVVRRHISLNIQSEGIMDEGELYSANGLGKMLKEQKLAEEFFCFGIPQYLCTTRLMGDVAVKVKESQVQKMVDFETTQLAGLSEESFLSDYCTMPPAFGSENPILIGFCREIVAEELSAKCGEAGVGVQDIAMNGLALANAFCQLHPAAARSEEAQLLLDIGTDNTTVVVVLKDNIRYTGSLMFGARRFTQVLAHIKDCSEENAEALKMTYEPDWEDDDNPFLLAAHQLEVELKTAMDNWRSSEIPELAECKDGRIWLSGGGALTAGLCGHLEASLGGAVSVYGPVLEDGTEAPDFVIAYGLALQGLGIAAFPVTLATSLMRWQRKKCDRFKYLAASVAVLFATLGLFALYTEWWISHRIEELNFGMEELRACDAIVPQLNKLLERTQLQQKMLIPFIELGGRSKLYMRTIEEVSKALGKGDWCIYITDEFSHKDYGTKKDEEHEDKKVSTGGGMFGAVEEKEKDVEESNDVRIVLGERPNMPLLGNMIIGGYATVPGNKRFETILAIQNKLKSCGLFADGVDWLDERTEWTGREAQVSQQWNNYLRNQKAILGEYTEFKLKLPLKKKNITFPPPPPKNKKKAKK